MENFDLKKFLTENKLTSNSKMLSEAKPTSGTSTAEATLPPEWEEREAAWKADQERDAFNVFNSKSEAVEKPAIKILKDLYYFDKLGSLGAKDDVDGKYHSGAKLVFKKGTLVADDTSYDDSEYKMITSSERLEKGVDYEVTVNSKDALKSI